MQQELMQAGEKQHGLYRLEPSLYQTLTKTPFRQSTAQPVVELTLPEPPFPQLPEKCGDIEPDPKYLPQDGNPYRTSVTMPMVSRALRGWLAPYLRSRLARHQA
jgi:hypothetical protein